MTADVLLGLVAAVGVLALVAMLLVLVAIILRM